MRRPFSRSEDSMSSRISKSVDAVPIQAPKGSADGTLKARGDSEGCSPRETRKIARTAIVPSQQTNDKTAMSSPRFVLTLLLSGLGLLAAALVLSSPPANAAVGRDPQTDAYRYTDHPARASTGRVLPIYIDRDFNDDERQRIASAIKQWNHVLNGTLRLRAELLPNATPQVLAREGVTAIDAGDEPGAGAADLRQVPW